MPYIVSRDGEDSNEKNQRRVSMSIRALNVPLTIAAGIIKEYEMMYVKKRLKILSATFDFVKTRSGEWVFLQMKSFRLTKSSRQILTSSEIVRVGRERERERENDRPCFSFVSWLMDFFFVLFLIFLPFNSLFFFFPFHP